MHHHSWNLLAIFMLAGGTLTACGGLEETPASAPTPPGELATAEQGLLTLVFCPVGAAESTYSPPLSTTPQTVMNTGTSTLTNCYSLFGGVTSGSSVINNSRPDYSCNELLNIGSSGSVITWNTGETSTLTQTRIGSRVEGLAVIFTHIGSVVSGKFEGATTVRTTTYLNTDIAACFSPEGLSHLSGTTTLTLVGSL